MKKWMALVCIFLTLGVSHVQEAYPTHPPIQTIVFLRHGEKPFFDFGQLICKGLNRALALPKVLTEKYGTPDYIFAPNPYWDGFYYYVRALITIEPTAISLNMPVNTDLQYFNDADVVKEFLSPKYHQSLIFVGWEHWYIVKIAKKILSSLHADPKVVPNWPENEYDSLYVIKIDWRNSTPTVQFSHEKQNLNNQSNNCPLPTITNKTFAKSEKKSDEDLKAMFVFVPAAEHLPGNADQLTCKGLNHALALSHYLDDLYPDINCFVLPSAETESLEDVVSRENAGNKIDIHNFKYTLMTIEPTIINRGGLFIPTSHKFSDAIKQLKTATAYKGTGVVTWPMEDMALLARSFYATYGGDPNDIPNPVPNLNTIYQITVYYLHPGKKPEFTMITQPLQEYSSICPGAS